MFEEIFFPKTAEKYRAGLLAEQRERYLVHLKETRRHSKHLAKMRQRSAQPRPTSEPAGRRPGRHSPDRGGGDYLVSAERAQMQTAGIIQGESTLCQSRRSMAALPGLAR